MKKIRLVACSFLILLNLGCAVKSSGIQTMVQNRINENKKSEVADATIEIKINKNIELANACKQVKSSFIPALLYWGWNSEVICEFSKETIENEIKSEVKNKIESLGLHKNLENKKLIITIDELPTKFKYQEKEDVVILLFAYVMSGKRYFASERTDFKGHYTIIDGENKVILENDFVQNTKILPQADSYKSTKKLSWQFIEAYNTELGRFVSILLEEVKTNIEKV